MPNILSALRGVLLKFPDKSSLRSRVLRGSVWSLSGHAASQILRLGGNLVLTRLLFPEAFGLMSLVQVFMAGLAMFSDLGFTPSIIHHKRGEDSSFLNTAWTFQVMRGFVLWGCAWLLAGPFAAFYSEPLLKSLLPVAALNAVISGFNSTKLASANRKLSLGRLTLVELGSYVLGLLVMVGWAYLYVTVWALVFGGLVGAFAKMLASHLLLEGEGNRFQWEKEAFGELFKFGRWVFLSSALTYLAGQGDRLIMGRLLDVEVLAFFSLAANLNRILMTAFQQVAGQVFFPSYAELYRQGNQRKLYLNVRKVRILQIGASWLFAMVFILWGKAMIGTLYDARYADAGWMLQFLAVGTLVGCLSGSYSGVLFGVGKPKLSSFLVGVQICIKLSAMVIGNYFWGSQGVIIGIAAAGWFLYPFNAFVFSRLSLWQPEVDGPVWAASCLFLAVYYCG